MGTIVYPTARWAQETPDHPAVIGAGFEIPYSDLENQIESASVWLAANGVVAADRVLLCAASSLEWIVTAHSCSRIGAILVPASTRLTEVEAKRLYEFYTPTVVVSDPDRYDLWTSIAKVLLLEVGRDHSNGQDHRTPSTIDVDRLHTIISTSGTEGEPRGVCLSFRNHMANALASAINLGIRRDDRWLLNLPLYHVGGFAVIMRSALYGTTVVLPNTMSADNTWDTITKYRVTQLSLVPTTLHRLVESASGKSAPAHFRSVLVGGAPAAPELLSEARALGLRVLPTYGMTETASQVATATPGDPNQPPGSVGRALALSEVQIRDEVGALRETVQEGRIYVRGPAIGMGYWRHNGTVESLMDRHGWFETSDVGAVDDNEYLTIAGRVDNVIKSGGEKIHAEEIERAFLLLDGIADAVVVSIPDPEWGEMSIAFVELATGISSQADANLLRERVAEQLPRYKLPRRIHLLDCMPLLASGKPDRRALQQRAMDFFPDER